MYVSLKLSFLILISTENPLKQRCKLLFPVKTAYAVMEFQEEALSQKSFTNSNIVLREKLEKSWLNGLWKEFTFRKNQMF